jgi:hypothetical protein
VVLPAFVLPVRISDYDFHQISNIKNSAASKSPKTKTGTKKAKSGTKKKVKFIKQKQTICSFKKTFI